MVNSTVSNFNRAAISAFPLPMIPVIAKIFEMKEIKGTLGFEMTSNSGFTVEDVNAMGLEDATRTGTL